MLIYELTPVININFITDIFPDILLFVTLASSGNCDQDDRSWSTFFCTSGVNDKGL
jgi:hypothetical protein